MEKKNTALQELIEQLREKIKRSPINSPMGRRTRGAYTDCLMMVKQLLPKEKADIVEAYAQGAQDSGVKAEPENKEFFFNQTFNQTP